MYRNRFAHQYNQEREAFIEAMMPLVEKLFPEEAHELWSVLKVSAAQNPSAVKVHLLNCRYNLAKKGKVRKECENFLEFLESSKNKDWNEAIKALRVQDLSFE